MKVTEEKQNQPIGQRVTWSDDQGWLVTEY